MKNKKSTIVLLFVFFIGLSLLLYPTVSDYWNSFHQTQAIASYTEAVRKLDKEDYEKYFEEAEAYNAELLSREKRYQPTDAEHGEYEELLNVSGTGVMGSIEIPSIDVSLPIYHSVEKSVLQIAVGHIEGTSLPVGGSGTHCVLSGHRGLPSAKLFTDLDKLEEGDVFMLHVLDEVLTYEVDQIHIVEPYEVELLSIEPDQDLCTLVTCTPYGINSHRLLVRGHRVENREGASDVHVTADAMQIDPMFVAPAVAAVLILILLIGMMLKSSKKERNHEILRTDENHGNQRKHGNQRYNRKHRRRKR